MEKRIDNNYLKFKINQLFESLQNLEDTCREGAQRGWDKHTDGKTVIEKCHGSGMAIAYDNIVPLIQYVKLDAKLLKTVMENILD